MKLDLASLPLVTAHSQLVCSQQSPVRRLTITSLPLVTAFSCCVLTATCGTFLDHGVLAVCYGTCSQLPALRSFTMVSVPLIAAQPSR